MSAAFLASILSQYSASHNAKYLYGKSEEDNPEAVLPPVPYIG